MKVTSELPSSSDKTKSVNDAEDLTIRVLRRVAALECIHYGLDVIGRNAISNQATNKLWPCGPIRRPGSGLDLVGQNFRILLYTTVVECAEASAHIGRNIDKANLLPNARALMGLYEFVSQSNFSSRKRYDSPCHRWAERAVTFRAAFPNSAS